MKRKLQRDGRNGNYFVWIQRSGVSRYFALGTNKRLAEKALDQVGRDIASGRIQFAEQQTSQVVQADGSKDIRVEELAVRHLEWVKANRSPATFSLRQHFVSLLVQFLGPCMVSSLGVLRIEEFRAWVTQRKGAKDANGREALRHVKTMLRWAEEYDVCAMPVRRFPRIQAAPPKTKCFSPQEISSLLAAAAPDFRDLLYVGMATGLRPQELRQLTRDNLFESACGDLCVRIERHKTAKQAYEPKPRSVPLSPEAAQIVRRQMDSHNKSPFVFLNGEGGPYDAHVLRRRLERLCKKIGMEKAKPPYAMRHTFGTIEGAAGTNQSVLGQLMGHARLQTTDRYIAHVDEAHRKAVAIVGTALAALLPKPDLSGPRLEGPADETRTKVATEVATEVLASQVGKAAEVVKASRNAG